LVTDGIESPGIAVILADRSRIFRRSCVTWLALASPTLQVHEVENARALPDALEAVPHAWSLIDPALLRSIPAATEARLRQSRAGLVWRSPEPPARGSPASARLAFHLPRPRDPQRFLEQWRYLTALATADLVEAGTVGEILGLAPTRAAAYLAAFAEETARCVLDMEAGISAQSPLQINAARHALSGCAAAMGARALARRVTGPDEAALITLKTTRERTLEVLALAAQAYGVDSPA
jgi:hypothetical protein